MSELPSGTVTFLFSDLASSSRLWEQHPEAMKPALARHDEILRDAVTTHHGYVVKMTGDGIHAAFATAEDALVAAHAAQVALTSEPWAETGALSVRMGLHAGTAEVRDGDYFGSAVNRAARIMSAAHGGQIAVSHATEELMSESLPDGMELVDLGEHRLRDLSPRNESSSCARPACRATSRRCDPSTRSPATSRYSSRRSSAVTTSCEPSPRRSTPRAS